VFAGGENKKQAAPPAKSLREALGKALVDYYPFAGRFVEEDGEVRVACTGEGAWFVEAAAACSLEEVRHLDHPMLIPKEELLPEPAPGVNPLDMPLMMQVGVYVYVKCNQSTALYTSLHACTNQTVVKS